MSPRRKLPPILADTDRIEAARIAADRLTSELRESELARRLWTDRPASWHHYIDSAGAVHSERLA